MRKGLLQKFFGAAMAAVLTAGVLAGCSSEPAASVNNGNTEDSAKSAADNDTFAASAGEQAEDSETDAPEEWEDVTELKLVLFSVGSKDGAGEVLDAVNEIAEKKAGVRISVEWIEMASWVEQMNMKMAGAETMDIIMATPLMSFSNMLNANQLMDITDLLNETAPEIFDVMPSEYFESVTYEGRIYGVPTVMYHQDGIGISMRTDTLEELGLLEKGKNVSSWSEFEEILEEVKNSTDLVPLYSQPKGNTGVTMADYADLSPDEFALAKGIDNLGDAFGLVYVDPETDTVRCYYQSEIFRNDVARAVDYYNKGYLYKDGATTDMGATDAVKDNLAFSYLAGSGMLGRQALANSRCGRDMTLIAVCPEVATTFLVNMWTYVLPYTCKEPEAAMRFLKLLFTDRDIVNLLMYGIEGRDYTLNDDGTVSVIANAPYASQSWLYGNTQLAWPTAENGADYRQQAQEIIDAQEYSKYMGFICDTSEITNEISACNNAKGEYAWSLLSGSSPDYEADYEAFMKKLSDSGIDKILECYQTQLDEWLANK